MNLVRPGARSRRQIPSSSVTTAPIRASAIRGSRIGWSGSVTSGVASTAHRNGYSTARITLRGRKRTSTKLPHGARGEWKTSLYSGNIGFPENMKSRIHHQPATPTSPTAAPIPNSTVTRIRACAGRPVQASSPATMPTPA